LQSRIQDLEKPPELRTSIGLCNPYTYPSMSGGPIGQSVISQKYCGSATSSRQSIQGQVGGFCRTPHYPLTLYLDPPIDRSQNSVTNFNL
jgi:hypothetical protein